jgi:hypothetical protein
MLDREFKLYFLHVPKTAGTSLRYWLWDAFASEDFLECHRVVDLDAADLSRIEKARFYSGHFGPLLWERLARRPFTVTMLREPVAQAFSTIRYLRAVPEQESRQWGGVGTLERPLFSELVKRDPLSSLPRHPSYIDAFSNLQVRHLAGFPPDDGALFPVTAAMYDRARRTLETLEAVGLVERLQESLLLFAGRLGWPPRALSYRLNETPLAGRDETEAALADNLGLIQEANSWDLRLYEFARNLFEEQLRNLRRTLGLSASETEARGREIETLRSAVLDRFLDTPILGPTLRYGRLTQSSGFFLDGWAERGYWPPIKRWLRWAGPTGKSTLYLALQRTGGPVAARFEIIYPRDRAILKDLEIRVDGHPMPITHMDVKQGDDLYFHVSEIEVPALHPGASRHWTTIEFVAASTDEGTAGRKERPFALGNIDLL